MSRSVRMTNGTCQGTARTEEDFNDCLCHEIGGEREVRHDFPYGNNLGSFVFVDCETEYYVIEGGLDKRSSLDSLQQTLFFGGRSQTRFRWSSSTTRTAQWGRMSTEYASLAQRPACCSCI